MSLPIIGKLRVSWFVYLTIVVAIGFACFQAYKIHRDNIVWCVTHSRPCEISRLENTRDELIKIKELDQTKKVLEEVGK